MQLNRHALLPFSAYQMYDLVNDTPAYPSFVPYCHSAEVLSETGSEINARLGVTKAGLKYTFTTCNQLTPGERIEMRMVDGPLKHLDGIWQFQPLGETACKVVLDLDIEFSQALLGQAFKLVFKAVADKILQAFCQRAHEIYEPNSIS